MSGGLTKATLWEVESSGDDLVRVEDSGLDVQFNPESLRLTLRNQVEGGESRGRQVRQHVGRSSTSLSFDLVFDTADEIREGGEARDVRERTAMVERFLVPAVENGERKEAPPMVQFHWGELILSGVMTSLSIDFELFSPDGIPLRAKMSVSIQEQDPRYQFLEAGAADNEDSISGDGSGSGQPGEAGSDAPGNRDRSDSAQEGESMADFASRQGLNPARWRAMADQVENPLSLSAGQEVAFDSSLGASLGVGARAGATGGAEASVRAKLGLEAGASGSLERGKALSGAGGLSAALGSAARAEASAEAGAERTAFRVGDVAGRGGGAAAGSASIETDGVDGRARAFGRGVPLRPLRGGDAEPPAPLLGRRRRSGGRAPSDPDADPGRPSWEEGS